MSYLWNLVPFAAMVTVECLDVGLTTLSKAAMTRGMSHFVFVVYSNALATLILLPSSFIFHRTKRPPLTLALLCRFFILGLLGITLMQNCVFTGVNYSSPTLGSALSNLIPAFTFIFAIILRCKAFYTDCKPDWQCSVKETLHCCDKWMEKLDLRSTSSQAKIMGTLVSISGALIITLYKGPSIVRIQPLTFPSQIHLPSESSPSNSLTSNNWILGGLFLTIACLSASTWITLQAATVKEYPAEMTIVSFYCFFGTIQCAVVSLFAERDPNVWNLRPDMELICIVYSAIFGSVVTPSVQTWCIRKKGPVFVATFKPLGIAIAAIMGVIFLGDTLRLGSVIGAIIISVGFYGVIWGQSKEGKKEVDGNGVDDLGSSPHEVPLLQD